MCTADAARRVRHRDVPNADAAGQMRELELPVRFRARLRATILCDGSEAQPERRYSAGCACAALSSR